MVGGSLFGSELIIWLQQIFKIPFTNYLGSKASQIYSLLSLKKKFLYFQVVILECYKTNLNI